MWLDTPSIEEQKIIDKYQKYTSRYNVLSIPIKYWDDFKEFESFQITYDYLFRKHFEDLKYYALMYRDVELTYDIIDSDMIFFAQRKNEIIGYKKKILGDCSLKSRVVQLYYEYEPMFIDFCNKFFKIEEWNRDGRKVAYNYCLYIDAKQGNYRPSRFSVNKLTDEQCKIILTNKNEIIDCNPSIALSIADFKTQKQFIEDFFIPFFYSQNTFSTLIKKYITTYINQNFPNSNWEDYINLFKPKVLRLRTIKGYDYFNNHLNYKGEDINILEASKPKLKLYPNRLRVMSDSYIMWELTLKSQCTYEEYLELRKRSERLEEERYNKEYNAIDEENRQIIKIWENINSQIVELKKQRQEELKDEYDTIIKDLEDILFENSNIWSYIYEDKNSLYEYINKMYNEDFKRFWLNDSNNCRAYLKNHRKYTGIVESFFDLEITNIKYVESTEYKDFISKQFERGNLDNWIKTASRLAKKEEEQEQIERDRQVELERIEYEKRMEKYRFNKRNAHARDKNIILRQSDHIYMVNGIALDSVTTFVNNAFPKFDAEYHAKRKAKQLGISPEEVLEMWEQKGKESRDLGTAMHSKIENYYLGNDSEETDAYKLFKMFASKIELKPYRTEWAVYDLKHNIAGTIDFVDYQNGEYIIYDWKRSEKIIENGMPVKINKYGEKGNYPLEHLDNTPYYHYALQLSLYKYILEKNYGMKISDLRLGIFHPTYKKPYVLKMPYLEKEINDIFSLRSEILF